MTEDDEIDLLIKEVSDKHGFVLPRNDPAFILYTINKRLTQDYKAALDEQLTHFKGELELVYKRWVEEASSKAQKIIDGSVDVSKQHIAHAMQSSSEGLPRAVRAELSAQLSPALQKMNKLVRWAMYVSAASLLASSGLLFVILHR